MFIIVVNKQSNIRFVIILSIFNNKKWCAMKMEGHFHLTDIMNDFEFVNQKFTHLTRGQLRINCYKLGQLEIRFLGLIETPGGWPWSLSCRHVCTVPNCIVYIIYIVG